MIGNDELLKEKIKTLIASIKQCAELCGEILDVHDEQIIDSMVINSAVSAAYYANLLRTHLHQIKTNLENQTNEDN